MRKPLPYQDIFDDAAISVQISGIVRRNEFLEPRLWEPLRIRLQNIYRRATGEAHATLKVEL